MTLDCRCLVFLERYFVEVLLFWRRDNINSVGSSRSNLSVTASDVVACSSSDIVMREYRDVIGKGNRGASHA
jgi:hypothetical protein